MAHTFVLEASVQISSICSRRRCHMSYMRFAEVSCFDDAEVVRM